MFCRRQRERKLDVFFPAKKAQDVRRGAMVRRSSWDFLAGKNKFDQENSYKTFCGENVPEKPLQTHRDKPSSIISASSVATMGIFP
jgi:hypothetical protein